MGLYVVFWRCADICAIDWPKLTLLLYILRFLFDFGAKMQFYAVFALGFALLWAPAMFFSCIIDSCNKKPCISFFLHLKGRALVFSLCIKIPCIGLRAIYVPALDFQISCKFPCNWILSLCIFHAILHCRGYENGSACFWFLANHLKSFGIMRMMFS